MDTDSKSKTAANEANGGGDDSEQWVKLTKGPIKVYGNEHYAYIKWEDVFRNAATLRSIQRLQKALADD